MMKGNSANYRRKSTQLAMERQPEAERASVGVMVKRNCSHALWESEFCENRILKRFL